MATTAASVLSHVRQVAAVCRQRNGFDAFCFGAMRLVSAEPGRVCGEIEVTKGYLNAIGGTHGGWLSTLVDVGGSLAIATHGFQTTGVSTDLSVSFLAPSGEGATVSFDARVLKLGRTLAYTQVDIHSGDTLIATGRHTKFVGREQARASSKAAE